MQEKITNKVQESSFWALSVSEVVELLRTNSQSGISEEEAGERLKIFGLNVIEKSRPAPGF